MNVRLTSLAEDEELIVAGAMPKPPETGSRFSVLVMSEERLIETAHVEHVGFDYFITVDGEWYSWARRVGDA